MCRWAESSNTDIYLCIWNKMKSNGLKTKPTDLYVIRDLNWNVYAVILSYTCKHLFFWERRCTSHNVQSFIFMHFNSSLYAIVYHCCSAWNIEVCHWMELTVVAKVLVQKNILSFWIITWILKHLISANQVMQLLSAWSLALKEMFILINLILFFKNAALPGILATKQPTIYWQHTPFYNTVYVGFGGAH